MGSLSNGGLCNRSSNEWGAPLKFKIRKVSAVRDFPPLCGPNAPRVNLMPQNTNAVASLVDKENLVNAEKTVTVAEGDCCKASEGNDSSKLLHQVEVPAMVKSEYALESKTVLDIGSKADGLIPTNGSQAWSQPQLPISDSNTVKEPAQKNKYPSRRVSATRDFPPFCGRNARCPTEEERLRIVSRRKTFDASEMAAVRDEEKSSPVAEMEIIRTGVEEFNRDDQASYSQDREMKGSVTEMNTKSEKAVVQGAPLMEKVRVDAGGSPVRKIIGDDVEEEDGDENAQNRKLEGSVPELKSESQEKMGKCYEDVNDVPGEVGKEIVIYTPDESHKSTTPVSATDWGAGVDSVIVQGLMAAPYCPWRQGKGTAKSGAYSLMKKGEVRKHNLSCVSGYGKLKSIGRAKDYKAYYVEEKPTKKKLVPSKKVASGSIVPLEPVAKFGGDFATQEHDECSPAGHRPDDFEVTLPPFGPNSSSDGNARNKVRETLRLFQAICRKLLQGEEAKSRQLGQHTKRIDLLADRIIRAKGKEVNTGKHIIGSVPGVEVGDEFQYRVELALVGIHRLYQAGIDYMKQGKGKSDIVAVSIVASGGYADDLDSADVLIYSGQGGNIVGKNKQPEDQKLEKGNLALKNSISAKNPVRVIRGTKETKASNSDARAKIVPTYTYDGLYTVERYWHDVGPHGKLVFKFELKRIPGQPELAWKEVKKSKKFKVREGLCVDDISGGKELFPICAVNTIDNEKPPTFTYITELKYPDRYHPTPLKGCGCIGGCTESQKCSCVVKNGGEIPYNYNGAIVEAKPLVYECGPSCKCPPSCYNRVSQHGIKFQLEIFKTKSRGWGVRSLTSIPSGSFICEYIGELLEDKEAEQRHNDEYLFDIGQNYSDCSLKDGIPTLKPDAQASWSEAVEDAGFTIDAAQFGNVGRFINHSCSPNLYAQNVLYDHDDKKMPHIMLFAAENIPPLQELTYHYNYSVDQVHDSSGNIKVKICYCGSAECTGRMY